MLTSMNDTMRNTGGFGSQRQTEQPHRDRKKKKVMDDNSIEDEEFPA